MRNFFGRLRKGGQEPSIGREQSLVEISSTDAPQEVLGRFHEILDKYKRDYNIKSLEIVRLTKATENEVIGLGTRHTYKFECKSGGFSGREFSVVVQTDDQDHIIADYVS